MLSVRSSKPCAQSTIEFDPYIPLEIRLEGTMNGESSLWWRALGEKGESIVELRVRPSDGCVQSVTAVLIARGAVLDGSPELEDTEQFSAAPCVDLRAWPSELNDHASRFVDATCPVFLTIGKERAGLWFTADRLVDRWFAVGQTRFGVLGQALVCVQVCGLTRTQLAGLSETVVQAK